MATKLTKNQRALLVLLRELTSVNAMSLSNVDKRIAAGLLHRKEPLVIAVPWHQYGNPSGPTYMLNDAGRAAMKEAGDD